MTAADTTACAADDYDSARRRWPATARAGEPPRLYTVRLDLRREAESRRTWDANRGRPARPS